MHHQDTGFNWFLDHFTLLGVKEELAEGSRSWDTGGNSPQLSESQKLSKMRVL